MNLSNYYLRHTHELDPIFHMDKERFMRFFNAVYKLLDDIQPGHEVFIPNVCQEKSFEVFIKVAGYYIYEESKRTTWRDSCIEFSDDYCTLKRSYDFPIRLSVQEQIIIERLAWETPIEQIANELHLDISLIKSIFDQATENLGFTNQTVLFAWWSFHFNKKNNILNR